MCAQWPLAIVLGTCIHGISSVCSITIPKGGGRQFQGGVRGEVTGNLLIKVSKFVNDLCKTL
jgi:hypothetical protein